MSSGSSRTRKSNVLRFLHQRLQRVLREAGYQLEDNPAPAPHDPPVHRFERARPNQLWQTDLFTFILKRQNRRVFLVGFMDDHSRFITSYGLHASASTALVLETFRAGLDVFGNPEEVLTDNGSQYITWRGTSLFHKECQKRGIKQVVASPRHPQTLGKIERFWGSLWRECLERAVFLDLADARRRIGLYIDHYNFQRAHQGIDGLVQRCEPVKRGRAASAGQEVSRLRKEDERLARECQRQQALVRLARQAAGLASAPQPEESGKKRRARQSHRGKQAAEQLRQAAADATAELPPPVR